VAANGAEVGDDRIDVVALFVEVAVEGGQVVQAGYSQRDLLDQRRPIGLRAAWHEGNLVIHRIRIRAEEDHASFGILFGDLHAQKIAVEGGHTIDVANENAQVTEPDDTWHGAFATPGVPSSVAFARPAFQAGFEQSRQWRTVPRRPAEHPATFGNGQHWCGSPLLRETDRLVWRSRDGSPRD